MANEVSIYEPRTMNRVVLSIPPVHMFFRNTFFKHEDTFSTKAVDIDFVKGSRQVAPYVHPRIGSKTVANKGYTTKSYTPPLVAPDKITTVEELMCTQAIFTGKIPIIGEGLNEEIDFEFTNTETISAATKKWSNENSDPIADLKRWHKAVQKTGFTNCDMCIMADDVATAFIAHPKVQKMLDVRNYQLAVIQPRQLPDGVTYVGSIQELGLDIYTYNEWYLDDWTTPEAPVNNPMVPDGTLALLSSNANYSMLYGAVTKLDDASKKFVTVEGKYVPNTWIEHKPDRRFLQLSSAPLAVPHAVDSWFVAKVL